MEAFWENIVFLGGLLIKAIVLMVLLDLISIACNLDMRVPVAYIITDWILAKVVVLR